MPAFAAHAFGLRWAADTPLPQFPLTPDDGAAPDVIVSRVATLAARDGGRAINAGLVFDDGIRFAAGGVVYDMWDGNRIAWCAPDSVVSPGDGPPPPFYGTVTALLLAWRGGVPLHGSAVEIDGRALLIGGEAGSGKSTLCAAIVAQGGRLISDDLSLLASAAPGTPPMLWPGRSAIRLVDAGTPNPFDKRLVRPEMAPVDRPVPLATLLLLRIKPVLPNRADQLAAFRHQLFRPRWMNVMPHRAGRMTTILNAARDLRVVTLPPAFAIADAAVEERAAGALALMAHAA